MEQYSERYSRHYQLSGFGKTAQDKLLRSSVLVVGAGGLGCPVLQYLAAAGVGTIGIADHDRIALSNLQRQTLFSTEEIGQLKAVKAAERIKALNPEISVQVYTDEVNPANAWELIARYDLIVDATDNFAARYLISDTCMLLDKPLVFGAIFRYEGQVAVFDTADDGTRITYRDLFPEQPQPGEVQDCNEAGVLGVLPGMIGMMQANEVIKYITGTGDSLTARLLTFNMLNYETLIIDLVKNRQSGLRMPKNKIQLEQTNYQWMCGCADPAVEEINAEEFLTLIQSPEITAVDVRENGELPGADFRHLQIPLSELEGRLAEIRDKQVVFFCQGGKRSLKAAQLLISLSGVPVQPKSLSGGIIALKEKQYEKRT